MSTKKESNAMFWGVVLGAIGGAAYTLLRTPKSGRELRGGITSQASRLTSRGQPASSPAWQSSYQPASPFQQQAADAAASVQQHAADAAATVQDKAADVAETVQQQAAATSDVVADAADSAADAVDSAVDDLTES